MAKPTYAEMRQTFAALQPALSVVAGTNSGLPSITRQFQYDTARAHQLETRFLPQHAELLLQQAVAFLNRILLESDTYRSVAIDQTNLRLDIDEFNALDSIHQAEVAANIYSQGLLELTEIVEADDKLQSAQSSVADYIKSNTPTQEALTFWSMQNSLIPYTKGFENNTATHTLSSVTVSGQSITPDKVGVAASGSASDLGGAIAQKVADFSLNAQWQQATAQLAVVSSRIAANSSFMKRLNFAKLDAGTDGKPGFRELRQRAAYAKIVAMAEEFTNPASPFNYSDRLNEIEQRAAQDFAEAYSRMVVARRGISLIYGIDTDPLPVLPNSTNTSNGHDFLNALILWARKVGSSIQALALNDQTFVLRVSLRSLVGNAAFVQGKSNGWSFELSASLLPEARYLRLRAISASLDLAALNPNIFISLKGTLPQSTQYVYGPNRVSSNQPQNVSPILLSRVTQMSVTAPPDLSGGLAILNASPLGKWQMNIADSPSVNINEINDITINLHLALQS